MKPGELLSGLVSTGAHRTVRLVEEGRLVYYRCAANIGFWENHWGRQIDPAFYSMAEKGIIRADLDGLFSENLPKKGRILEAGCGLGEYVVTLRVRGYNVEGVEWSSQTVEDVRALKPGLPIRIGDVTSLDVPDCYYSGYICLGVVEHLPDGPDLFLGEAHRVLEPGGVALISVPWFNPLRRLKARFGWFRGDSPSLDFYQYAFTEEDFVNKVETVGFEIIKVGDYARFKGLKDEFPFVQYMYNRPITRPYVEKGIYFFERRLPMLARYAAHMLMVVARKP